MILEKKIVIVPLENRRMVVRFPQGWTLDAVAFAGPDSADDWQVVQTHRDGVYRVSEDRGDLSRRVFEGSNLDAAIEQYFVSVRKLTMKALGVAYQPVTDEVAPLSRQESAHLGEEREGT